jgi:hypothetical protein
MNQYSKLSIDYGTICKNYNTTYLDRDNDDPATMQCMRAILSWTSKFLQNLIDETSLKIFRANCDEVDIDSISSKRFLFYSLEKEITLQNFSLQNNSFTYDNIDQWLQSNQDGLLIQNDEDGECLYLYVIDNSKIHHWLLQNYSENIA